MNSKTQDASRKAQAATDNRVLRFLGRAGLVAHGVVHLLLAYLAVRIAIGGGSGGNEADKSGALATIGRQPGGRLLLWAIALGLLALAVWQATDAVWGQRRFQGRKRLVKRFACAGKAVLYGTLAVNAAKIALTGAEGSSSKQKTFTTKVLDLPFGQVLVGAVGVAVLAAAGFLVYHGLSKRFTEDLDLTPASRGVRTATVRLGQLGYPAVGAAYGLVGLFIVVAAVTYDPQKATGLDVALKTLAGRPYGAAMLIAVAAGLVAFGVYRFFDARFHIN